MGKYIFLTGYSLPKPGATGMCIHQVAKQAVRAGHEVYTLCYADGEADGVFDGVHLIKVKTPAFLRENANITPARRKLNYLCSLGCKLLYLRKYPLRSVRLVHSFCAAAEKLMADGGKVTLVASVFPLEAVLAADRLKHKYPNRVKTVYYCADTLSNEQGDDGILSAERRTQYGIRWERKLFASYDRVIIMECHAKHYYSDVFAGLTDKMRTANFPLLSRPESADLVGKKGPAHLVYAGTLYRGLRNPSFLCDLLVRLSEQMEFCASFLGGGDCEDILDAASKRSGGIIRRMGMQPHSVAAQYIANADVLLSIGNLESPMAPSKIYEYMATGKPIIHVYTYDEDPCLEPLERYGNALLLRDGAQDALERTVQFVRQRQNLTFEDVQQRFVTSMPEYTLELIDTL